MIFQKFAKFICDCFCRGPVPREVVTNVCTASGGGSNPMRGSSCSEPTLVEATILRAADPPECHGGDATLCSPMPLSFRVVFPCPVPGSGDCPPALGGSCDPDMCLTFVLNGVDDSIDGRYTAVFNALDVAPGSGGCLVFSGPGTLDICLSSNLMGVGCQSILYIGDRLDYTNLTAFSGGGCYSCATGISMSQVFIAPAHASFSWPTTLNIYARLCSEVPP